MNPIMIGGIISVLLYFVGVFVAFGLTKHHIDKQNFRYDYDRDGAWIKYGIFSIFWPIILVGAILLKVTWKLRKILGFPYYLTLWALNYPDRRRERKKNRKFVFLADDNKVMEFKNHEMLQEYFNSLRGKFVHLIRERDNAKNIALDQEGLAVEALNANNGLENQNTKLRERLSLSQRNEVDARHARDKLQDRVDGLPESTRSIQTRWKGVADRREIEIKDLEATIDLLRVGQSGNCERLEADVKDLRTGICDRNNSLISKAKVIAQKNSDIKELQGIVEEKNRDLKTVQDGFISLENERDALQLKVRVLQNQLVEPQEK